MLSLTEVEFAQIPFFGRSKNIAQSMELVNLSLNDIQCFVKAIQSVLVYFVLSFEIEFSFKGAVLHSSTHLKKVAKF